MKKTLVCTLVALMGLVIVLSGCDNRGRGVPTRTVIPEWSVDPTNRVFSDSLSFTPGTPGQNPDADLLMQIGNPFALLKMEVYVPRQAWGPPYSTARTPIPTLILLGPQHEFGPNSDWFYFERGLFEVAEEMIAEGEIQPMMIVVIGNNEAFGGYWYGNSYQAGFYDHLLGVELINRLEAIYPINFIDDDPQKLGIGGVGQGAYGAFRAAIQNPGTFGSITAVDGPLDFDGAPTYGEGLVPLFAQAIAEQGLTPARYPIGFDSTSSSQLSRMLIGGALAFSPHDTALSYTVILPTLGVPQPPNISITARLTIDNAGTLVDSVVGPDAQRQVTWPDGRTRGFAFHLPFDATGQPVQEIWDLWLANDLERLHTAAGGSPLSGVNIWVAASSQARWGFGEMTKSWVATLQTAGYSPELFEYSGYQGYPAERGEYTYDLLRDILRFHSESFGN